VLAWIKVPRPSPGELLRAYKISKRYDDDISAVCLVVNVAIEGGTVARVSIGAGGVAATPARARRAESALRGKPWTADAAKQAAEALRAEFQPISDMRASAAYRSEVLGNLMQRFWLESQGLTQINLESFTSVMPGPPSVMPGHDPASMVVSAGGQWIADQVRNDNGGRAA
jgi:xanthine dehydrogenase small subunit